MTDGHLESRLIPVTPTEALSQVDIVRSDQDIRTLTNIRGRFNSIGIPFVLSGGYAVEAYRKDANGTSGNITRAHEDMDSVVYVSHSPPEQVRNEIAQALEEEQSVWELHKFDERTGKLEFREKETSFPGRARRRLEVRISKDPNPKFTTRSLRDSTGREHTFEVEDLAEMTAVKIGLLTDLEKQQDKIRPPKQSDIDDLRTLMTSVDFDKSECIKRLTSFLMYHREHIADPEVARETAEIKFEQAAESMLKFEDPSTHSINSGL